MIEIKITGATPTEALISLAAMGLHCQADPLIDTAAPASASAPAPVAAPVVPAPAPAAPAAPVAPGPTAAPGSMPAAAAPAPSYTQEQLSKTGVELVSTDPAKMTELSSLLAQYGVQAITQLAPAQYGAFATALRGLGARI